jgi:hypothetical protein
VVNISMSEADAGMLREMLEARLRDLRLEISHTDSPRFREGLNAREEMLQRLLAQLGQTASTA